MVTGVRISGTLLVGWLAGWLVGWLAAMPALPVDNPSVCRASSRHARRGAFGSGSRPDGPVASGHPCPPLPESSIPAALAWPSVFAAALRIAHQPQGLSTSQAFEWLLPATSTMQKEQVGGYR
ncbi:hypothetical protein AAGR22_12970 [Erwinia sp. HDF1-3R]|uniref:hypothetical protein n=1 Tax=Erwinia sp. HDF1-3R TaxID=3141543 RepID=UPI0031F54C02